MNDIILEESLLLNSTIFVVSTILVFFAVELQYAKKVEKYLDFLKSIINKDGLKDLAVDNSFLKQTHLELTKEVEHCKDYLSEIKKYIEREEYQCSEITKKGIFSLQRI